MKQGALIIANGERLAQSQVASLAHDKFVVVCDGAYEHWHDQGLAVDVLIGDMDSVTPELLIVANRHGVACVTIDDQSTTDLEKAITHCDSLGMQSIDIVCALGHRHDHTLHNTQLLSRYHRADRPLRILTHTEVMWVVDNDRFVLLGKHGDGVAILGAPNCTVTTQGLQYDMHQLPLRYGVFNSTSNALIGQKASIDVTGMALVIHERRGDKLPNGGLDE